MNVALGEPPTGPCAGFRVVDFSTMISGPFCTMFLGDLGADVIKVEPTRGDSMRLLGPPFQGDLSAIFAQFNRNKRSLALDLKSASAAAVVVRLVDRADVVVHNYRPGVAERIGIGDRELSARNPRLVYAAVTGFGPDGPYAGFPAYDSVVQGTVGHMPIQGAGGTPSLIRSLAADKATAVTTTWAILAALLARERGGGGQKIDVAMLDAYAAFLLPDAMLRHTFLPAETWASLPDFSRVHRSWATADGFVVLMFVEDGQWAGLCRVVEHDEWIADERFATLPARLRHFDELLETLESELRRWPTTTLVERARRLGVPLAKANALEDFLADPQVAHNRTVFEVEDGERGRIRYLRNPARFEATPPSLRRHPPRLGEHTDEVLAEIGFGAAAIASLRGSGTIV